MNLNISENENLKKHNTFGLGGYVKYFFTPTSKEELQFGINDFISKNIPYYILGCGSNVIFPDNDFDGAVICLKKLNNIAIENNKLTVDAGVMLPVLNNAVIKQGYTNFAWSSSIPATVGGAVVSNAGANGKEICEDLLSITYLKDGEIITSDKSKFIFEYRKTSFSNEIILGATFNLQKGNVEETVKEIQDYTERRKLTQPLEYKNAGSTFRNPEGNYAGKLIEECDLKEYKIGGAMVSAKHANFIINYDNASSDDIKNLIYYIQKTVKDKTNIDLVMENKIILWDKL
ncbi:MAG: UDP-N-acetylmuramate dehydrogenase [bacterium]